MRAEFVIAGLVLIPGVLLAERTGQVLPLPIKAAPAAQLAVRHMPLSGGSLNFQVVEEIDSAIDSYMAFGDTDSDGLHEIISQDVEETYGWSLMIAERQTNGVYAISHPLGLNQDLYPYVTGDFDKDGKMEILGQLGARLRLYESSESGQYPTQLVWESPILSGVLGLAIVGDTDSDERCEFIHSVNGFAGTSRVIIFENLADNAYSQVGLLDVPGNVATGEKVIVDLDQDGQLEFAVCGDNGFLRVFESRGDNDWQIAWTDTTELDNAYGAEGGYDTDGNGRPELFIRGNDFEAMTWPARVYEVEGGQLKLINTIPIPYHAGGHPFDALGDLDSDGDREYIMETGSLTMWDGICAGSWKQVGFIQNPGSMGLSYSYDLDRDGRWEVVWHGDPTTWVLRHVETSDIQSIAQHTSVSVLPNPVVGVSRCHWSTSGLAARSIAVYDVAGRMVQRWAVTGHSAFWDTRSLAAGGYFVQLLDARGTPLARTRAIVRSSK